jgi:hypothetical protein
VQKVEFAPSVCFRRGRGSGTVERGDHSKERPRLLVHDCPVEIADGKQVLAGSGGDQQEDCET